ncbi:MAG: hypothetical protein ACREX3_01820 [Gammaproteobacteria bacterium]
MWVMPQPSRPESVEDTREWLETVVFPGERLIGGLSPSGEYTAPFPGVIQAIEEFYEEQKRLAELAAAGGPVTWKWGL